MAGGLQVEKTASIHLKQVIHFDSATAMLKVLRRHHQELEMPISRLADKITLH